MTGEGPCRPVAQEATTPVGTSFGQGDSGPVGLHPLVDWESALTRGSLTTTPLLGRDQTH